VNQVTSASLRYPLSVFNKKSTLKTGVAGFIETHRFAVRERFRGTE